MTTSATHCPFHQFDWQPRHFQLSVCAKHRLKPSFLGMLSEKFSISYLANSFHAIIGIITGVFNDSAFRLGPHQFKELTRYNWILRDTYSITDPSMIEEFLKHERNGEGPQALFSDGLQGDIARAISGSHNPMTSLATEHQQLRRFLIPYFAFKKVKEYAGALESQIDQTSNGWKKGQPVDITAEMKKFTLHVLSRHFLGLQQSPESVHQAIHSLLKNNIKKIFLPNWVYKILNYFTHMDDQSRQADELFRSAVHHATAENNPLIADMKEAGFSMEQITDTVKLLFIAGQETTASLLTSLIYELAKNPEWIDKIRKELNGPSSEPLLQRIQHSKSLQYVFLEGLRCHNPVISISRVAEKDLSLRCEESGEKFQIPKGRTINLDNDFSFRDERRAGHQPDTFDPSRYSRGASVNPRSAFSAGPGECLGKEFANLEVKIVLAKLIEKYHWTAATPHVKPQQNSIATIQADHKEWLITRLFRKLTGSSLSCNIFINFTHLDP